MKEKLFTKFAELYGTAEDVRLYFSPGRVNLIGEHTDYNGGHVFPCALTIGTYGAARQREDRLIHFLVAGLFRQFIHFILQYICTFCTL